MPNRLPQRFIVEVISSLIGLILFALALLALHRALGKFHYYHVLQHLHAIPGRQIALALLLTVISYLVLTAYNHLAVSYVRHPLPGGRITLASFICYAFSNSVGISLLTGGSLRYRFYSAWGLSGEEISWIVAFTSATLWLGILTLAGFLFLFLAPKLSLPAVFPLSPRLLGVILLIPVGLYLLACWFRRVLRVKSWEFTFPSLRLAIMQLLIGAIDWALAGSILFILLPSVASLSFGTFLSIYLLAQAVGLISNVPGGLGVFETLMLLFLKEIPAPELLATLLVFRGIYYLFPLGVATVLLGGLEILERRTVLRRIGTLAGHWASVLAPPVLAAATLVAGAILLFSGATPAVPQRLGWLHGVVPLSLLEVSPFLGSLTGAALLLLARGLQRRLDGAFLMTVALLAGGSSFRC